MKNLKKALAIGLTAASFLAALSGCGSTKAYPNKQVNVIVHAAAGGGSDMAARMVSSIMEESLGVPFVVENKTGASGSVAMQYVAASKADGYTIGTAPCEISMVEPLGYSTITPDSVELLGLMQSWAAALTVPASAPYDTFDEFVEYAKAHPGELRGGNSGTGSIWHIAGCILEDKCGVTFNHVPFDGASGAVTALLGGHCDFVTVSVNEVLTNVESGDLKVLAVMADERSPAQPDVPTTEELGYDATAYAWVGLCAPKGLPQDVKDTLVSEIQKAVESDKFGDLCAERGTDRKYLSPDEFHAFATEQYEYYKGLIPGLGITK